MKKKSRVKKTPVNAKPDQYFVLMSGSHVKNLKELAHALENMNDDVFYHHVNDHRNDFANWVNDVLREESLSSKIKTLNSIHQMEMEILRHLVANYI